MNQRHKKRLLRFLVAGSPLFNALDVVGVQYQSYRKERDKDPIFAHQVDVARAKHHQSETARKGLKKYGD